MNYNNDLPGGKQATNIYYMDYAPLSKIRKLNEMDVTDSLLGM
jgi:hypothetical protein